MNEILGSLQPELRLRIEIHEQQELLAALLRQESLAEHVTNGSSYVDCIWRGGRESLPELHRTIVKAEIPIISFSVEGDNLEDIYMRISGHHTS